MKNHPRLVPPIWPDQSVETTISVTFLSPSLRMYSSRSMPSPSESRWTTYGGYAGAGGGGGGGAPAGANRAKSSPVARRVGLSSQSEAFGLPTHQYVIR